MKKFLIFFVFFIYSFLTFIFPDFLNYTNDSQIELDDCIKLAILNSRKLKISEENLILIQNKTKEALSYRFPKINFIMNYGKFNTKYDMLFSYNENVLMLDKTYNEIFSNRLYFSQILYRGNFAKNIKKSSKTNIKQTKAEYEFIKINIIFDIKMLFENYLFLSKKIDFYKKYLKYLEYLRPYYLNNENIDFYKKNEFNLYFSTIEQTLNKIILDRKLKKLEIFKQIGLDLNSNLEIKGIFKQFDYKEKNLNEYIARGLIIKPELILSETQEELSFIELNITMNEKNPFVSINGIYDYYSSTYKDNLFTSTNKNWFMGLGINWPLIDGGTLLAKNNQKKSNLKNIKLKRIEIEENIKLEITKAYENYILAKNILEENKNFYLNYKHNKKEFKNIFEFFDSDNKKIKYSSHKDFELLKFYENIFINYIQSIFDYNKSMILLQKETGDM